MIREGRALIGYMPKDEALAVLRGPDLAGPTSEHESLWQRMTEAVQGRPASKFASPLVDAPEGIQDALKTVAARPDLKETFAPHNWKVRFADLRKPIISYQKVVITDGAVDRVSRADRSSPDSLLEICLPEPKPVQLMGGFDASQNAYTATALNPNLRVGGFVTTDGESAPGRMKVVGFALSFGSTALQIVEYRNRWMIRDGHHRVYGLLKRGIYTVPCIVIEAQTFEETGAGRAGFLGYEVLYGDRPPLISDFTSEEYSAQVPVQAVRKIVRIKAEEFVVPV